MIEARTAFTEALGAFGLDARQLEIVREAAEEYRAKPTNVSALRLQQIPATEIVQAELDALMVEELAADDNTIRLRRIRAHITEAERTLELALIRDELQESRPSDCWCLGYGGRSPRFLPISTGYDEEARAAIIEEREIVTTYCPCPDGTARKISDDQIRAEFRDQYASQKSRRILRESGLPGALYSGLRWREHPDRRAVQRCAEWLEKHGDTPWLLLYGKPGRGKTALATGLGYELVDRRIGVVFRTVPEILQEFRSAYQADQEISESARIDAYKHVPYLILDDIAAEKMTDSAGDRLYQIINHRHNEMRPTIFTSNLDPEQLTDYLGSRIWGRIKRLSKFVAMAGPDLRDAA